MKTGTTVKILGIDLHPVLLAEFLDKIQTRLSTEERLLIGNVNIHAMNLVWERASFRDALKRFDIIFCDGFGVMLAAKLIGQRIPERYTPPDFIRPLTQIVRELNGSIFLLGAAPGVAERAAQKLIQFNPGLKIAGVQHGYFDKALNSAENKSVIAAINASCPSLLLVAFGMPQQEEWLAQNWSQLTVNAALTVGALFDTLAGDVLRAPHWLTSHGFEWLARLMIEPRRLWRRYIIGNPLFFLRIVWHHWLGFKIL